MKVDENIVPPTEICESEGHGVSFIPSMEEKSNFSDYLLELSEKEQVKHLGFAKIRSQVSTFNRARFYEMAKDSKQSMPDTLAQWVDSENGIYALTISRVAITHKKPENADELARRGIRKITDNISKMTVGKYMASRINSPSLNRSEEETQSTTSELERKIFESLTGHNRIYPIGDTSFFPEEDSPCALNQITSYLKETIVDGEERSGIDRSWSYIGEEGTIFALHSEDSYLHSINFNHGPGIKIWYVIPPYAAKRVEEVGKQYAANFPSLQTCSEPLQHKVLFIPPEILRQHEIPFTRVIQRPGDYIFVQSHAYHQGINVSLNVAEAVNYANLSSIPEYVKYRKCSCGVNCGYVINMNPLVDVAIRSGALRIFSEERATSSPSNSLNPSDAENSPEEKEESPKHFCLICRHLKIEFKNQVAVHYRNCNIRDHDQLAGFVGESLLEVNSNIHDSVNHNFIGEPLKKKPFAPLSDVGNDMEKNGVLQNPAISLSTVPVDNEKCIEKSRILQSVSLPLNTLSTGREKRIRKPKILKDGTSFSFIKPKNIEERREKTKVLQVVPLPLNTAPAGVKREMDRTGILQNVPISPNVACKVTEKKKINRTRKVPSVSPQLSDVFSKMKNTEALNVIKNDSTLIGLGNDLATKLHQKTVGRYLRSLGRFLIQARALDESILDMATVFMTKDMVFINNVLKCLEQAQLVLPEIRKCARFFRKTNEGSKRSALVEFLMKR